ncbi:hypothetical protein Caci_6773 [Catenulispora acidiphila DSM 44928]|uniref:Uncharacterized protein n=1 Tax=Catenulispora acidiphila (strain DSM 44928 / JCM 14897 / NBRC 102108 / NRRL B-24433 / ID139908) TaxID=479433 RepID=C7Q1R5_CATAD|nr:hypothetical protein Caci_6773 [Catenulispora acidiphila DSM 44928]
MFFGLGRLFALRDRSFASAVRAALHSIGFALAANLLHHEEGNCPEPIHSQQLDKGSGNLVHGLRRDAVQHHDDWNAPATDPSQNAPYGCIRIPFCAHDDHHDVRGTEDRHVAINRVHYRNTTREGGGGEGGRQQRSKLRAHPRTQPRLSALSALPITPRRELRRLRRCRRCC